MKFGRTYAATIQTGDPRTISATGFLAGRTTVPSLAIQYPLTMEFDVIRNTLASANTGLFRFFNLKPDTRAQIFHDRNATNVFRRIVVQAGYETESPLPTIFRGNIIKAGSYRSGSDWITEIEAFDGGDGILNGQVAATFPPRTLLTDVIKKLLSSMPNIALGAVSAYQEPAARGVTLSGNAWQMASDLAIDTKSIAFVDNEKANFIKNSEYVSGIDSIPIITSATGLLQTPRRFDALLEVDVLFEPRVAIGQRIQLVSLEAVYNGLYVVNGIHHHGTISGAVCGPAVTTISLNLGAFTLTAVKAAA